MTREVHAEEQAPSSAEPCSVTAVTDSPRPPHRLVVVIDADLFDYLAARAAKANRTRTAEVETILAELRERDERSEP
jgi:hypothetical protein